MTVLLALLLSLMQPVGCASAIGWQAALDDVLAPYVADPNLLFSDSIHLETFTIWQAIEPDGPEVPVFSLADPLTALNADDTCAQVNGLIVGEAFHMTQAARWSAAWNRTTDPVEAAFYYAGAVDGFNEAIALQAQIHALLGE